LQYTPFFLYREDSNDFRLVTGIEIPIFGMRRARKLLGFEIEFNLGKGFDYESAFLKEKSFVNP